MIKWTPFDEFFENQHLNHFLNKWYQSVFVVTPMITMLLSFVDTRISTCFLMAYLVGNFGFQITTKQDPHWLRCLIILQLWPLTVGPLMIVLSFVYFWANS